MSAAKLQAARELIRERNYDAARAILETIPSDPTAKAWLAKLDDIAPAFPTPAPVSQEAERFYRAENKARTRRRIGGGIELIMMGVGCFFLAIFFGLRPPAVAGGATTVSPDPTFVVIGLVVIALGVYLMRKKD